MSARFRPLQWFGIAVTALSVTSHSAASDPKSAYELSLRGRGAEADTAWQEMLASPNPEISRRECLFGRAANLTSLPQNRPSRTQEALTIFRELVAENAGDDFGIASAYYLIRLREDLSDSPQTVQVTADSYVRLHQQHPRHLFGQLALLKATMLQIWNCPTTAETRSALQKLESYGASFTLPEFAVVYHFLMGDAYLTQIDDPESSLRHQRARNGRLMLKDDTSADLLIKSAELAREMGAPREAAHFYREFLKRFPSNVRAWRVRTLLTDMEPSL